MEDINDWELLHGNTGGSSIGNSSESTENLRELDELEGDSDGVIRSDYFSLYSEHMHAKKTVAEAVGQGGLDGSEEGSVGSDNPSWIDPGSENQYPLRRDYGGFLSDSSSDDRSYSFNIEGKNGLGCVENVGVGESSNLDLKNESGFREMVSRVEGVNFGSIWSDSGGIESVSMGLKGLEKDRESRTNEFAKEIERSEIMHEEEGDSSGVELEGNEEHSDGKECAGIEEMKSAEKEEKRRGVWWKVPLELLKYCVFRVSPVWSFSVAAAVIGFVILGRRLYKMKRKAPSIQLKVTVDDKKVSQFMSRAARLNEAFSVVRRVPVIRAPLPAPGVAPWPVMSLR
ncbi:hypothetical protein Ancab_036341 [Ancistrocladus abbreviatus]